MMYTSNHFPAKRLYLDEWFSPSRKQMDSFICTEVLKVTIRWDVTKENKTKEN